ncbi:MAG TPA: response regulator [Opitutaceae bacterium]|jgi:CheY-like chemotaxis protein|nr:response regulator [Opitutaceae bacterium]
MSPIALKSTILLVEDEPDDVFFMKLAFKRAGLIEPPHVARDGHEAIAYLNGEGDFADRSLHPLPSLVLLDLKLPRIMGMEVLKWIRARPEWDLMVVIILTSSQQAKDIREACALRANSYLLKPSNPDDLAAIADLLKRYWLTLNQPTATGNVWSVALAR